MTKYIRNAGTPKKYEMKNTCYLIIFYNVDWVRRRCLTTIYTFDWIKLIAHQVSKILLFIFYFDIIIMQIVDLNDTDSSFILI